jgi:hypothetical protein
LESSTNATTRLENAARAGQIVHRLQACQDRLALGPAHRVVDAGDTPLEDLQVLSQLGLEPLDFLQGDRLVELIEKQPDLRAA